MESIAAVAVPLVEVKNSLVLVLGQLLTWEQAWRLLRELEAVV